MAERRSQLRMLGPRTLGPDQTKRNETAPSGP
jgi:hypothetical protein